MILEQLIKKNMWLAYVAFVVLSAYLTANGINMNLRDKISTTPKIDLAKRSAAGSYTPVNSFSDYQVILDRNVFNSESVLKDTLAKLAAAVSSTVNPGNMDLVGTMAGKPEVSLALIMQKNEGKVDVYKIDDKIGDYLVTSIEPRQVRLLKDGKEEILKMAEERPLLAFKKPKTANLGNLAEGIKQIGEDERVVDKRLIDSSFDNWGKLMRQGRIMPHIKNGKIDGFKVSRIKKDSLYEKIGLVNGDVIKRVNGNVIKGPEDGLKLFEIFKTAKSISIDLDRKGKNKTLSYSIR